MNSLMDIPKTCLKGIPRTEHVYEDGSPSTHLFEFKDTNRGDGYSEQSINWEDNPSVVDFTLNQKKDDGSFQFKIGVAILPREEIDRINKQPTVNGVLSYERAPLDGNDYHGNILLSRSVSTKMCRKISAGLALAVSRVIRRT
jgi:hypothetical protein